MAIQTALDIIIKAARVAALAPEEQDIPGYILNRGLEIFNDILLEWSGLGVFIPYQSKLDFDTIPGQQSYFNAEEDIPVPSGNIDIVDRQIIQINYAKLFLPFENSVAYTLNIIDEKLFNNTYLLKMQSIPSQLLLRVFNRYTELVFYPIPAAAYKIEMICKQRLDEVQFGTTLSELPDNWLNALKYQIALDYSVVYQQPLMPVFEKRAALAIDNLKASNIIDLSINKDELLTPNTYTAVRFPFGPI